MIRRVLADGKAPGIESAVLDDMGEILRPPASSAGAWTGDPSEDIDGAEGGDVAAGTEAR